MIDKFEGKYHFLSNFYEHEITLYGRTYLNAEAAFHAQKVFEPHIKAQFQELNPSQAKRLGRSVELRDDWEEVKDEIMEHVIRAKFSEPDLQDMLIDTGDQELIEGNWWGDRYWGVSKGTGLNKLGNILMKIRDELKPIEEDDWTSPIKYFED